MKMTMTDGTVFEGSLAEYAELLTLAKALDAKVEADVATIKGEQTTPVIPQVADVVTFEGFDGEYRKVERKAQAGDFVVFRENEYSGLSNGVPYLVKQGKTSLNVRQHTLLYQPNYGRTPETVDVFEKVEAQYVPQEGDIVVVTANNTGSQNSVGDIGKVGAEKPLEDGGVCVYAPNGPTSSVRTVPSDIRKATTAEVEAYEKAVHKASFSVGDYVKLVNSKRENNGAICVISDIDGLSLPVKLRHISGKFPETTSYATYDQIVKATEQEVADASKPKLKAGDFVKITRKRSWYNPDKIYEVKANQHGELCVIDEDGDENPSAFRKGEYVLATVEEVAKHVDEAKLAKIGRKVGEFKEGDVARVLAHDYGRKVGEIGIVEDGGILRQGGIGIRFADEKYVAICWANEDAELIAPVESTLK